MLRLNSIGCLLWLSTFLAIAYGNLEVPKNSVGGYEEVTYNGTQVDENATMASNTDGKLKLTDDPLDVKVCDCRCKCCLQALFNCETYCVCTDKERPRHQFCPYGLKFNPDIENCDLEENFVCEPRPTQPPSFKCPTPEGLFQFPGNCSLFIQCAHGNPYVNYCPAKLHFCPTCDPPKCDYPIEANCTAQAGRTRRSVTPNGNQDEMNTGRRLKDPLPCTKRYGFFPVPNQPDSFYKCVEGFPTRVTRCPSGLLYDPREKACTRFLN